MSELRDPLNLTFGRYAPDGDEIELFDVSNSEGDPNDHIYSCVAICRKNWRKGWPALGGTRWLQAKGSEIPTPEAARKEAASLALAMFMKNNLLRKAERELDRGERQLYGWQGGKGVIWTPWKSTAEDSVEYLTPQRLMCHGRLIEKTGGDYIGSMDAGVHAGELRWIERATNYTIGNGCLRDTGQGTAYGVHSGIVATVTALGKGDLKGVPVLVCGLGKVGFPLMQLLHADGAIVFIREKALHGTSDADLTRFWESKKDGYAINDTHLATLKALRKNIYLDELEALESTPKNDRGIQFICPAGSNIEWLTEKVGERPRYEIVASRADASECVILGPANDQLPMANEKHDECVAALDRMDGAGVVFVPDPIVSPGGVIAVSHELTARWDEDRVRNDSIEIVRKSIEMLFARAGDKRSSKAIYEAFVDLATS